MMGGVSEQALAVAEEVVNIAEDIGCTPSQVALNWVRQQPGVMVPLIGARTEAQAKDNLGCLSYHLTDEHMAKLNEVSAISYGFPHEFLSSDFVRDLVFWRDI